MPNFFIIIFFNDTATTEIYTLSLHDALPIFLRHLSETEAANGFANRFLWIMVRRSKELPFGGGAPDTGALWRRLDRKSTRLNSSHANISYAVFCLKKKKNKHSLIMRCYTDLR